MKHGTFYAVCLLAISLFLWWREGWVAGGVLLFLGLCFGMSLGLFRDVRQVKKIARSGRWCRVRIVERLEETSPKGEALLRFTVKSLEEGVPPLLHSCVFRTEESEKLQVGDVVSVCEYLGDFLFEYQIYRPPTEDVEKNH